MSRNQAAHAHLVYARPKQATSRSKCFIHLPHSLACCNACRALERLRTRFDVTYALPLLAITLLHHREALVKKHGEEAWQRAYAATNAERFYGVLFAPVVAATMAAVNAGLRGVASFKAEQGDVERAAMELHNRLDLGLLKKAR